MHINDGIFNPINPATHAVNFPDVAVLTVTWAITLPFLVFAWKKTKSLNSHSLAATLSISSALVFVAQLINFPVAGGTTVHVLGATLLTTILGPFAAMLSMTIVLLMQAFFFADGGLLAFGANALNMAVIGGLSFFLVKFFAGKSFGDRRLAFSVFAASWASSILTALATGLEVGFSSTFINAGGIALTVPSMVGVYAMEGLVEAVVTTALVTSLVRLQPRFMVGLDMLRGGKK
jgi:cobalt/nickel transport system permease protein